jgi:hypothetical protein
MKERTHKQIKTGLSPQQQLYWVSYMVSSCDHITELTMWIIMIADNTVFLRTNWKIKLQTCSRPHLAVGQTNEYSISQIET